VTNIQPVIPISINEDWNLITRTSLPVISQPSFARGQDRQNGAGDTTLTLFASPAKPVGGEVIVGGGPSSTSPPLRTIAWAPTSGASASRLSP
jgi:hypothetical protein